MAPSETLWSEMGVRAMRLAARDIHLYELYPLSGAALPAVEPGAHVDLLIPNGRVRPYSLITPLCDARRYVIGVQREAAGRGGSRWLHDNLRLGSVVKVGAPRNNFELALNAQPYLLAAGGIGITPIYSIYRRLQQLGKPVHLHYWGENAETMAFYDELAADSGVTLYPRDASGARPRLAELLADLNDGVNLYCCGPDTMIDDAEACAQRQPSISLHTESFGKRVSAEKCENHFTVVLAKSGRRFEVPEGKSILETLTEADIDVMYSCEQGICGACETHYLEGEALHLDKVKAPEEHEHAKTIMICCSRAKSKTLVLDI